MDDEKIDTEHSVERAAPTSVDVVEAWFNEMFPGSIVARDTEAYNLVHRAKEDLKKRLADK